MMSLFLPTGAHLRRARESLAAVCDVLEKALAPAMRYHPIPDQQKNDICIATVFHALAALDAARAVHLVSGSDYAGTISMDYRTVFECLVKILWIRKDPHRARAYLASEPFERYVLANATVKQSPKWPEIVAACKDEIQRNPWLLKLPGATKGANHHPDFKAIAKALRMPSLEEMAQNVGIDDDAYLIDSSVTSLTPHTSVVYTKNFAKSKNPDGTINLSTKMDDLLLAGYVVRTATRSGEVLQEVLNVFPDGATMHESEVVVAELTAVVTALKGYMH